MAARISTKLLLAAVLAGTMAARAEDKPDGAAAATGAITGLITDREGRPLAGAEVWGVIRFEKVAATRTDAEGRFRLGPLDTGTAVTVWGEAPGVARERRDDVHVFAGRDHEIRPLALLPGTRITGRVVDVEGRPVAGAKITVKDYRHIQGHGITCDQAEWTLATDAEGRFATTQLPAGSADLMFASPGKVRTLVVRKSQPGISEVDLGDVALADEVLIN